MLDVVCLFCNLSIIVPELKIQWSYSRKRTLGTLIFHRLVTRPAPPTPLSSSEMARVQALRVACEDEIVPVVPVRERMAEAPALTGAAGANTSPRTGGGSANESGPQSIELL
jgi:hypothetical protein